MYVIFMATHFYINWINILHNFILKEEYAWKLTGMASRAKNGKMILT